VASTLWWRPHLVPSRVCEGKLHLLSMPADGPNNTVSDIWVVEVNCTEQIWSQLKIVSSGVWWHEHVLSVEDEDLLWQSRYIILCRSSG
jgi:hypothetical protein